MKIGYLGRGVGLASAVLLVALGSASADEWFVLSEKPIKSMDPSVEITKVVLKWKGKKDDTITNVGVVKSGGSTAEKDAPGREATLTSVAVQYKILNSKPAATLKVWGYD